MDGHVNKGEEASGEEDEKQKFTRFYRLPRLRFTNFMQFMLVADLCSSMVLWLVGGDTKYFENHITRFTVRDSVIDLAVLSFVRCSISFFVYGWLEDVTLIQIDHPYEPSISKKKCLYHVVVLFWSVGSLAYSITKGVLIYNVLSDSSHKLHVTYYALIISSISFCFLEAIGGLLSFPMMKKLKVQRILITPNDESKEKPKKKVNVRRLASLAKPEAGIIFIASIAMLISTGSQIAAPYFFGMVITASMENGMAHLNRTILYLLGIYIGGSIGSMIRAWLYTLAGQRLVARIRKQLFNAIMRQEVAFFDTNRTGELNNRLSSDTQVIQNAITVNISMLLRYILQIVGSIIFMFTLSAKLTGVLVSVVPVIGIGAQQYGRFIQGISKRFQDEIANAATISEESVSNIRTVRSFSQEKKSTTQFAEAIHKSYKLGAKLAAASGIFNGIVMSLAQAAIVLVLWYGGKLVNQGELNVGILTAFMLYTLNVAMAFAFLSSLYGDFMKAVGASHRMFEIMDRVPDMDSGDLQLDTINKEIVFNDVCFHYPTRTETEVLKSLSFKIAPGETVALVGPSGGGKSTVISLLERFYDPVRGVIKIGNVGIPTLDVTWYRRKLALVSQEPVLFATTIAENIAYGREATQEEIEDVARQANAHDFISSFESGYQTEVGERGVKLSGGQKQRVAIARALLMNPQVLLLDEATSALDAESEYFVQEAIDRAMVNRTVLVIAHRLSTVRNADMVLVMDKGKIVERGSHDDLIALNGVYKKLVLRQLTGNEAVVPDDEGIPAPKDVTMD
ncbi:ABC transporter B family member 25 [Exaiptasia diaphana]|uniref:Uncharacterized protein n=1 Tax=Exaiptasia diaphana TaxID=2652724 RepID=A0A913Y0G6_EXADI|nr:ABC transporter B family member 25 [Exaiptasia diaphana]XP_020913169.1 ABC transporter B family member 25 [Exaiptasia diaphana]KXJ29192.1 ABC transporter B family member 1 [Exaiptasia diaphana]